MGTKRKDACQAAGRAHQADQVENTIRGNAPLRVGRHTGPGNGSGSSRQRLPAGQGRSGSALSPLGAPSPPESAEGPSRLNVIACMIGLPARTVSQGEIQATVLALDLGQRTRLALPLTPVQIGQADRGRQGFNKMGRSSFVPEARQSVREPFADVRSLTKVGLKTPAAPRGCNPSPIHNTTSGALPSQPTAA
jgi:hypothetical protein